MTLEELIERLGTLLIAGSAWGLEAEVIATVVQQIAPEVTEDQLIVAINAAFVEWDL
jgi:hypothetical protein